MSGRRYGRIVALEALYQIDVGNCSFTNVLKLEWIDQDISKDLKEFIEDLINGPILNLKEIDDLVIKYSNNWSFERISPVDKAILRFSIYSLLYREDIPASVVIDEAIEIAKIYSTEKSYQFINGILDGIKTKEIHKK